MVGIGEPLEGEGLRILPLQCEKIEPGFDGQKGAHSLLPNSYETFRSWSLGLRCAWNEATRRTT